MRKLRFQIFQHDPMVGPGYIGTWLGQSGYRSATTRFFLDEPLPALRQLDGLIILGGGMGVYDYDRFPWLYEEKRCIEQAIKQHKIVLGICLGAQLIAEVMGARIFKTRYPEIGWHPVELSREARATPILQNLPRKFNALHWHEDAFDLPEGAIRLGSSRACLNQGFVKDGHIVGIQFHPETQPEDVRLYVEQSRRGNHQGAYVQPHEEILSTARFYPTMHQTLARILENVVAAASVPGTVGDN
jgi:GMP synthase (glutamine-hydrolysing)